MKDFIMAALPWVVTGLAIALACGGFAAKKKKHCADKKAKVSGSGLALGMCLGVAAGTAIGSLTDNMGLWMPLGMSIGMLLGMAFGGGKDQEE